MDDAVTQNRKSQEPPIVISLAFGAVLNVESFWVLVAPKAKSSNGGWENTEAADVLLLKGGAGVDVSLVLEKPKLKEGVVLFSVGPKIFCSYSCNCS